MSAHSIRLNFDGHVLDAVPAIHFRTAFAQLVNQLCADPKTRPEAIAVELGPQTCAAAACALKQLIKDKRLPCMLALTRVNRHLKASMQERATELQRRYGMSLHELPPKVLYNELGYSALSVLFLSPTDSIIEAIRCALELNIPLYGVDLEDCAPAARAEIMIEDTGSSLADLSPYVQRNAPYAERQRDDEVDTRREQVMAARLRHILAERKRVLFTGGLAHWPQLRKLLTQPPECPCRLEPAAGAMPSGFELVLVHPVLASYHTDVFPRLADWYQTVRPCANDPGNAGARVPMPRVSDVFSAAIEKAYKEHFGFEREEDGDNVPESTSAGNPSPAPASSGSSHRNGPESKARPEQLDRQLEDLEAHKDFEQLLDNLCLLSQRTAPDMFTALQAAEGTMSRPFREKLASRLMEFSWATPSEFPRLSLLAPMEADVGDSLRAEILDPEGDEFRRRGQWLYFHANPGRSSQPTRVKVPWEWRIKEKVGGPGPGSGSQPIAWPPNSYLLTALSLRARQISVRRLEEQRVLPFEGGLGDGVDVKATLRSYAKGAETIFIRERARRKKEGGKSDDWDPVVWLVRPHERPGQQWQMIGFNLGPLRMHAVSPEALDDAAAQFRSWSAADHMISGVGFGRIYHHGEFPPELDIPGSVRTCDTIWATEFDGIINYTPAFFEALQEVRLAEARKFKHSFFYDAGNYRELPAGLLGLFQEKYGIQLDAHHWPTALVQLGIPLARESVTVIAPDSFELPRKVYEDATRCKVKVRVVPHSFFPRDMMRRIGQAFWVPVATDTGANAFDPGYTRILGEPPDKFANLIPTRWLNYGGAKPGDSHV